MRITAGKYKNKKLFSPADDSIRPTMEKAKEALFSRLQARFGSFTEMSFLDVFAGSGSMGFEALSRGFSTVAFIDSNIECVLKNSKLFEERVEILRVDATNLPKAKMGFDVVFMDAPYFKGLSEKAYASLKENGYIKEDAIVIVEVSKNEKVELAFDEERNYGVNKFLFLFN